MTHDRAGTAPGYRGRRFKARWLAKFLVRRFGERLPPRRAPDLVIPREGYPYLSRWFLIPRNPLLNIYLHVFTSSDEDRALHDHPWPSASICLGGSMLEILHRQRDGLIGFGDIVLRRPRHAHRLILVSHKSITLFITGPRLRGWGFWCEPKSLLTSAPRKPFWRRWQDFTKPGKPGEIGRGCE